MDIKLKYISQVLIYTLNMKLRNKALLKIMRKWNKILKENQYVRIFTERPFKQKEVYNYIDYKVL